MVEQVKRSKNFYFYIYRQIRAGKNPSKIAHELKISNQSLNYYLSFLKKKEIIVKSAYSVWSILRELTEEELKKEVKKRSKKFSSRGMKIENIPTTNLHALEIKFPILEGIIYDKDWEIKNKLKNWLPKYKGLTNLGGLTIRNNNNKSVTIFAKARDIKNLEEVDNLAFKIRTFVYEYFKNKHNVILDVFNCETQNLNLATEDKPNEGMLRKGEKFELKFNKQAEQIFPNDKIGSKAWLDGSPFKFTAETNDKAWKRNYLRMPFAVRDIHNALPLLSEYNKNLKLHIQVQQEQLKTQKDIQNLLKQLKGGLGNG